MQNAKCKMQNAKCKIAKLQIAKMQNAKLQNCKIANCKNAKCKIANCEVQKCKMQKIKKSVVLISATDFFLLKNLSVMYVIPQVDKGEAKPETYYFNGGLAKTMKHKNISISKAFFQKKKKHFTQAFYTLSTMKIKGNSKKPFIYSMMS